MRGLERRYGAIQTSCLQTERQQTDGQTLLVPKVAIATENSQAPGLGLVRSVSALHNFYVQCPVSVRTFLDVVIEI